MVLCFFGTLVVVHWASSTELPWLGPSMCTVRGQIVGMCKQAGLVIGFCDAKVNRCT